MSLKIPKGFLDGLGPVVVVGQSKDSGDYDFCYNLAGGNSVDIARFLLDAVSSILDPANGDRAVLKIIHPVVGHDEASKEPS